jgi:hypothetical protein
MVGRLDSRFSDSRPASFAGLEDGDVRQTQVAKPRQAAGQGDGDGQGQERKLGER